jgi:protein tyrosine phosphatase (PTP) superfamily phosphohydrolase (DUF442 family)
LGGCILGFLLAVGWEMAQVMFGKNFHTVIPGRVFRCAQLGEAGLEQTVKACGIRTVINLRGNGAPLAWYVGESRVAHRFHLNLEDVSFSASRLPSVQEVRQLMRVLEGTEYPVLLHCRQGADRTGLAAGMVMLFMTETSLEQARKQLGWRFGHVAVDRAAHLDRFFDLYSEWLQKEQKEHTPELFRHWAEMEYCPAECRCNIEVLDLPTCIPRGQPALMRFRMHNTSLKPWKFRPENNAGIHLSFVLKDSLDRGVTCGRSGLINAEVTPGQTIDLSMVLPALTTPGQYRLLVDLVDEQHCNFFQAGSEPFEHNLEIYDSQDTPNHR